MKILPILKNSVNVFSKEVEHSAVHDAVSMDSRAFNQLKGALKPIDKFADENNRYVDFYVMNSISNDKSAKKYAASKDILVIVTERLTGFCREEKVVFDEKSDV